MLPDNREKFEYQGITRWHELGFKGQEVKIGVIDTPFTIPKGWLNNKVRYGREELQSNAGWSHGAMSCHVLHQVAPEVEMYLFDMYQHAPWDIIHWCLEQDIRIISASLGYISPSSRFMRQLADASEKYIEHGGLLFASAGNSAYEGVYPPAKKDTWVAVGAADLNSIPYRKSYSSVGSELEIMGFTNLRVDVSGVGVGSSSVYGGTSCACPNVAGCTALYASSWGVPKGKERVRVFLHNNTVKVKPKDKDGYVGYGLLVLPEPGAWKPPIEEDEEEEEHTEGGENMWDKPFYKVKEWWTAVIISAVPLINYLFDTGLDPNLVAYIVLVIVGAILGKEWKDVVIMKQMMKK